MTGADAAGPVLADAASPDAAGPVLADAALPVLLDCGIVLPAGVRTTGSRNFPVAGSMRISTLAGPQRSSLLVLFAALGTGTDWARDRSDRSILFRPRDDDLPWSGAGGAESSGGDEVRSSPRSGEAAAAPETGEAAAALEGGAAAAAPETGEPAASAASLSSYSRLVFSTFIISK